MELYTEEGVTVELSTLAVVGLCLADIDKRIADNELVQGSEVECCAAWAYLLNREYAHNHLYAE